MAGSLGPRPVPPVWARVTAEPRHRESGRDDEAEPEAAGVDAGEGQGHDPQSRPCRARTRLGRGVSRARRQRRRHGRCHGRRGAAALAFRAMASYGTDQVGRVLGHPLPARRARRVGRVGHGVPGRGRAAAPTGGRQGAPPGAGRRRLPRAASAPRPRRRRPSTTPTSWPSTTGARTAGAVPRHRVPGGGSLRAMLDRGRRLSPPRRSSSASRRPAASTTPTARASSTATSSPPTCCSATTGGCASPTSAWPGPWPRRRGPSPPAWCSAPPATPRPSRRGARPSTARADVYCPGPRAGRGGHRPGAVRRRHHRGTLMARLDKLMPVSAELGPLAAVLERAGRPDPADRFDAAELGRALVAAAERLPRPGAAAPRRPTDADRGSATPGARPVAASPGRRARPPAAPTRRSRAARRRRPRWRRSPRLAPMPPAARTSAACDRRRRRPSRGGTIVARPPVRIADGRPRGRRARHRTTPTVDDEFDPSRRGRRVRRRRWAGCWSWPPSPWPPSSTSTPPGPTEPVAAVVGLSEAPGAATSWRRPGSRSPSSDQRRDDNVAAGVGARAGARRRGRAARGRHRASLVVSDGPSSSALPELAGLPEADAHDPAGQLDAHAWAR